MAHSSCSNWGRSHRDATVTHINNNNNNNNSSVFHYSVWTMDFTSQAGWSQSQNLFVDLDSIFDFYIFIANSHIVQSQNVFPRPRLHLSIYISFSWSKTHTQNQRTRLSFIALIFPASSRERALKHEECTTYTTRQSELHRTSWTVWLHISINSLTNAWRNQTFAHQNTKRHQTVQINHSWWVNCYSRHAEGRRSHRHLWPIRRWCLMTVTITSFWEIICVMLIVSIKRNRSDHL